MGNLNEIPKICCSKPLLEESENNDKKEFFLEIPNSPWLKSKFLIDPCKIKFLGKGANGQAYQMISNSDKVHRCVKIIHADLDDIESLNKEAEISKFLDHKNIIKLIDHHLEKNKAKFIFYLVFELGDNNLNYLIQRGVIPNQILFHDYACQLIQALKYCHRQNIVHFDIKPDNILMFGDNKLKICDWGSALLIIKKGKSTLTQGKMLVTPAFASPEINHIIEEYDENDQYKFREDWQKADVYSLGLTLINLMGLDKSEFKNFKKKKGEEHNEALKHLLKKTISENGFHSDWIDFFQKILEFDPKHRFDANTMEKYLKSMNITNNQHDLISNIIQGTGTLDLVFVIDITGSMDPYIEAVLNSMQNILKNLKEITNDRTINIGCIFYQDFVPPVDKNLPQALIQEYEENKNNSMLKTDSKSDIEKMGISLFDSNVSSVTIKSSFVKESMKRETNIFEKKFFNDFSDGLKQINDHIFCLELDSNIEKVIEKLKQVKCSGGYDECEDLVGALNAAIDINWTNQSDFRNLIIITDAPTHGKSYHNNSLDYYPDKNKEFDNLEETLRKLSLKKVGLIVIEIKKKTKLMFSIMEEEYSRTKGHFQKVKLKEITKPNYLKKFFEKTIVREIETLFNKKWDLYLVDKISKNLNWNMQIDWERNYNDKDMRKLEVKVYDSWLIKESLDFNNLTNLNLEYDSSAEWPALISKSYVLRGNLRDIHLMSVENGDSKYVIKLPQNGSYNDIVKLFDDWKNYLIADYMAKKFKMFLISKTIDSNRLSINFLNFMVLESLNRAFKGSKFLMCEPFLEGAFIKYNNNLGWVLPNKEEIAMNNIVQSFSHFSFLESKGKLVVVDIQGVGNTMTDPAIQSLEEVFGTTDLGRYGIYKFLKSHRCNRFCEMLNFPKINEDINQFEEKLKDEVAIKIETDSYIDNLELNHDNFNDEELDIWITNCKKKNNKRNKDLAFKAAVILRANSKHKKYIDFYLEKDFNWDMNEVKYYYINYYERKKRT